jgi:hypothetical protein
MAKTVSDLLAAAKLEWDHWKNSVWNLGTGKKTIGHTDDERAFAKYVIDNYCAAGGGSPTVDEIANDDYAWSAVGISAIFKTAGFARTEFPFNQSHSVWLRRFIKARQNNEAGALYWGYRLNEAKATPEVGDLIAYARGTNLTFDRAQAFFDKTGAYNSHSDLVVAKRAGEIDVIGFNVLDSVTKKTVPLDASGKIADRKHHWFVVLRRKSLA